jgi:predicted RNA-binding Zn ribbon-like protein
MVFAHDVELALQAAVALVNSAEEPQTLTTVEALDEFFREHGYTGRHERTRAELDGVLALRVELRDLLLAGRDDAVDLVNRVLEQERAVPRLVRHDALDWHLHAVADDQPLPRRIRVETAMAMIDVIRADEHSRLAVCADDGCEAVALDLSRNRSKRYCSATCANRNAAAAYRARRAT